MWELTMTSDEREITWAPKRIQQLQDASMTLNDRITAVEEKLKRDVDFGPIGDDFLEQLANRYQALEKRFSELKEITDRRSDNSDHNAQLFIDQMGELKSGMLRIENRSAVLATRVNDLEKRVEGMADSDGEWEIGRASCRERV